MVGRAAVWSTMLVAVATALAAGSGAATTTTPTTTTLPANPGPSVPSATTDTGFLRAQAEVAATDYFAANVPGGVSEVACAPPPADVGGVQFLCYAVDASGNVVVARATVNDYGTPELAPVDGSALPATTLAAADDPTTATYQGTGNATVAIDPVVGITLVAVTTTGSGPFTVQPEQASAPVGPPMLDTTAPVTGRYFAGTAGPFSSFAVSAQGDWTIRIQRLSSALALTATTPVTAVQPDVASYADTTALMLTLEADGAGPLTVIAVTAAGPVTLLSQQGPFSGPLPAPAGPGFVSVDAVGSWTLSVAGPASTTTSAP